MELKGSSYCSSFPDNFLFGTASSSYQFEGDILADGKGLSNWDNFTHSSGNILDGSNGDIAVDHYHLYLEDIDLMEKLSVNSFRFSISWARILPKGRFGNVNMAGIDHCSKCIDALLRKGIQPFVTLTHYDVPQELEERYGAWLSPKIRIDFQYYADICFKFLGNRVKYWVTFNEPNVVAIRGYRSGIYPPSRCSRSYGNCSKGNSEKEPLIAAHNMILCHAAAVNVYRTKYQKEQKGRIGIVMNSVWYEPFSNSSEDKLAAERAQSFYMNWFLDPIMFGKYPEEMHRLLGPLLPVFSKKDLECMSNSLDFIGINHYTSFYSKDCMYSYCESGAAGVIKSEGYALRTAIRNGALIGEPTEIDWLYVYPQGMEKIVTYIKDRYNNTPMFITENGVGTTSYIRNDVKRVEYMSSYLDSLATAIRKGADVRGYFAWALLDNFEWIYGFTIRFGLYHVDFHTLKRTPRLSAAWYKEFIETSKSIQTS
ncbi:Beta-glucosidase, lactase phlorizinhydrolase [Handroanthus impetiginosus]|uniref:Beta-glucosidase, lactase phlorizinhydrolase n=1 Tax=Handroanthus impetiginosus TaxID=429701 RepID=A0A2G9HUE7_9LAMI|nr:Beta-glucosidase, lactase phlorizinhydrolase [Handroanthus impetiginosus]